MVSIINWLKSAQWYYLLAISVGGALLIALIITAIVLIIKKKRNNSRRPTVSPARLDNIVSIPSNQTSILPETITTCSTIVPPANEYSRSKVYVDNQGNHVIPDKMVPFVAPIPSIPIPSAASLSTENVTSTSITNISSVSSIPSNQFSSISTSKPRESWINLNGSARKLPTPISSEFAAENAKKDRPALANLIKEQIWNDLKCAEIEDKLNEEVSDNSNLEDDISYDEDSEEIVSKPNQTSSKVAKVPVQKSFKEPLSKEQEKAEELEVARILREMSLLQSRGPAA